jgi:hypothetical protein
MRAKLNVHCDNCRQRVIVNVDHLAGDLTVPSFGPRAAHGVHEVWDDGRSCTAELEEGLTGGRWRALPRVVPNRASLADQQPRSRSAAGRQARLCTAAHFSHS